MAKGTTFENDLLKLIFNGTTIAGIAQNASSPATSLPVALHTADPAGGTQATSEAAYTGYGRISVSRATGWTVTGNSASPVADIVFGAMSSGTSPNITHFSVGDGAGKILYSGALSSPITMAVSTAPKLTIASVITES